MSSNILSTRRYHISLPEIIMSQDHDDAARVRDRREEYITEGKAVLLPVVWLMVKMDMKVG